MKAVILILAMAGLFIAAGKIAGTAEGRALQGLLDIMTLVSGISALLLGARRGNILLIGWGMVVFGGLGWADFMTSAQLLFFSILGTILFSRIKPR